MRPNSDTAEFEPVPGPHEAQLPSALVRVEVAARSDPGKVRPNNEDHYLVARADRGLEPLLTNLPPDYFLNRATEVGYGFLVADGMGGAAAGEVASRTAIGTFVNLMLEAPSWVMSFQGEYGDEALRRFESRFRQIDAALSEWAQSTPALHGMGTTLTLATSVGAELLITHVGDSRAYVFRHGRLRRLTHDQTVAQQLADAGQIQPEEVATHRFRHVLSQAIGRRGGEVQAEVGRMRLADGDQLLLCTDGLTEMVGTEQIAEVLANTATADEACRALVDAALEHGGKDNVTVVLAHYHIPTDG